MHDIASEIFDRNCDDERRLRSIAVLASDQTVEAEDALIRVAQADRVSSTVAAAAGAALAGRCFHRAQDLGDLVLAEMTVDAYLAYDNEIARLLREHPETRMKRAVPGSGR